MAQAQPHLGIKVVKENIGLLNQDNKNNNINNIKKKKQQKMNDNGDDKFKFNAQAQEFVPKSMPPTAVPVSGFFVPCFQYGKGADAAHQWIFVSDKDAEFVIPTSECDKKKEDVVTEQVQCDKKNDVLTEQLQNKIIKQVEYQLSDMSLLANENLEKQIQNDSEGFVPISLVSSTKKLKSIVTSNQNFLVEALHASTKLEVSSDGTRVKRKNPFTQKEKEELQSRTVLAENLPNDHSHQNLEKIFNVAGVVKTIRVCQPQEASSRGNGDSVISTKLHALVEFENIESAEKAVEKLNDYKKRGKSLRVRMLIRRSPKSVLKNGKSVFDGYLDDEEEEHQVEAVVEDNSPVQQKPEPYVVNNNAEDTAASSKKVSNTKARSKPNKQRSPTPSGRVSHPSLPVNTVSSAKQTTRIPRMPDGTKGFTTGRGRQITISV